MGLFPGSSCFNVPIFVHIGLARSEWQTKTWFQDEIRSNLKLWPLHARSKCEFEGKTPLRACAHIQVATLSHVLCKFECSIPSYSKNGYVGAKIKIWRVGGNLFLPNHLMIIFFFIYLFIHALANNLKMDIDKKNKMRRRQKFWQFISGYFTYLQSFSMEYMYFDIRKFVILGFQNIVWA